MKCPQDRAASYTGAVVLIMLTILIVLTVGFAQILF
jgi:hypothetical protein